MITTIQSIAWSLKYTMAETSNIAKMAEKISEDIFKWFKWEHVPIKDLNFACHKGEEHSSSTKDKKTHPVDTIFKYKDPYKGREIIFNTDLKSYQKNSITSSTLREAIWSLARTIDCADGSNEWHHRYALSSTNYEIRGLLFVYNHDGEYQKDFINLFKPKMGRRGKLAGGINIGNVPLREGQQIHIIEPLLIQYMRTVISDMDKLHREGSFPETSYSFYYPDLLLHKLKGDTQNHPATIELISGPYMIIKHDEIIKWNEKISKPDVRCGKGYVIYYNQTGETYLEFIYLFDMLSNLQILRTQENKIRIRVAHREPFNDIRSNFQTAINIYTDNLGGDEFKAEVLKSIEFEIIEQTKDVFSTNNIGWDRS
ncbi:MAG: hypothetical protein CENE_02630 [Candidatus Celerinatantimonas neptuna]|nr:MAG: hypothetical protein CENE_02630 [Candidatus Celerinatantimonas neptuna]